MTSPDSGEDAGVDAGLRPTGAGKDLAVVVQGGGMRGTYSIAALAELDRLGVRPRVHTVAGTSAGGMNAAYFASGQAEEGIGVYTDLISNRRFIDYLRRPVIDIDFLVDDILKREVRLDVDTVLAGEPVVRTLLADVRTGLGREFVASEVADERTFFEILRAGAALPLVFGREIAVGDSAYVDGGLAETIYTSWLADSPLTDVIVILTRPLDYRVPSPGPLHAAAIRTLAGLAGHSPGVRTALGTPDRPFADLLRTLQHPPRAEDAEDDPVRVWVVAPSDRDRLCSRLTTDRDRLVGTAALAREDVGRVLEAGPVVMPRRAILSPLGPRRIP